MSKVSIEKLNELRRLENVYFELMGAHATETRRCKLQGELVDGFIKTSDKMVDEAIAKLLIKIEELKSKNEKIKDEKNYNKGTKMTPGVVVAQFEGWDADTGERIEIGDYIVKTWQGWSKIENAF